MTAGGKGRKEARGSACSRKFQERRGLPRRGPLHHRLAPQPGPGPITHVQHTMKLAGMCGDATPGSKRMPASPSLVP